MCSIDKILSLSLYMCCLSPQTRLRPPTQFQLYVESVQVCCLANKVQFVCIYKISSQKENNHLINYKQNINTRVLQTETFGFLVCFILGAGKVCVKLVAVIFLLRYVQGWVRFMGEYKVALATKLNGKNKDRVGLEVILGRKL